MTGRPLPDLADRTVVVAGNGCSVEAIPDGVLLADDFVIRTNNFFFERRFHLGRRVDLALMGGDPRVAPFMFETLYRCRADYDIRAITSVNSRVAKAGQRRFAPQFCDFPWRDEALSASVRAIEEQYARKAMTGTYAVLAAYGLGARSIILAGFDLYSGPVRYPYPMGPHQRALMEPVINPQGLDADQHDRDLDFSVLKLLLARGDVTINCATNQMAWGDLLPSAKPRPGVSLIALPKDSAPTDWASNVGLYPIHMLRFFRWARRLMRRRTSAL